jgi:hypothetical protein
VQSLSGRIFRKTRQKFFGSPCANQGALAARNGRDGISNAIQNSEKQHERIEDDRLSGVRIMITQRRHAERHRTDRIGWLRAAVLGPTTVSSRRPVWWLGLQQRAPARATSC